MTDFDRAVAFVLRQEGGFSADANDPGGVTHYGLSSAAHPDLDVRALTREQAVELYRKVYWFGARCDALAWPLSLALFDGVVQHGRTGATRLLQRALRVTADGVLGPETLAALAAAPVRDVLVDYLSRRAELYLECEQPSFLRGWFRRLFDLGWEAHP